MEKQAVIQQKRKGFHFRLQVEERSDEPPKWLSPLLTFLALIVAFVIAGILISLVGGNPIYTYSRMWKAAFGTWFAFSDSLTKAIPLIFCGVACALAFHMKIWNIGAEGQFFLGAFGASLVVLAPIVPKGSSSWVYIPDMMLSGMFFGALWGFIPGYLKAKLGVNEIISTLMLNYIAVAWNNFFPFRKMVLSGIPNVREVSEGSFVAPSFGYRQEIQYQSVTGNGITFGHNFCACNSNHYVLCYI